MPVRSWTSTQNLSSLANNEASSQIPTHRLTLPRRPASWASTPELDKDKVEVTINLPLPRRRLTVHLDEVGSLLPNLKVKAFRTVF